MRIIELTSPDGGKIYINIDKIGHFYRIEDKIEYGRVTEKAHTRVGCDTHNNGGFKVKETPEHIIKKISGQRAI